MLINAGLLRDRALSGGRPLGSGQSLSGTFDSEGAGGTVAGAVRRADRGAPSQAASKFYSFFFPPLQSVFV